MLISGLAGSSLLDVSLQVNVVHFCGLLPVGLLVQIQTCDMFVVLWY